MTPTQRKAMEQAMEALIAVSGHVCQAAHHAKRDQHSSGATCPVETRHDAAVEAMRAALAEHYCDTHYTWLDHAAGCDRAEQPAEQEPVGYMNAGHVYELQQKRIPYGYVYPNGGTGAEVAIYTAPQPAKQPHKLPYPPPQAEIMDVCYVEGWNACCDAFFGGKPPADPVVITIETKPEEAPQPAKLVPLADEEITTVAFTQHNYPQGTVGSAMFRKGVRFAERAHGITGETQ